MTIEPHGGTLINRTVTGAARTELLAQQKQAFALTISDRILSDLYLIAVGGLSPLSGFMGKKDYTSVVETMHLSNGLVFSIPVVLAVPQSDFQSIKEGSSILLKNQRGEVEAVLNVQEKFERDVKNEAVKVYRTDDGKHPGVAKVFEQGAYCIAGPISYVNEHPALEFPESTLTPAQMRQTFDERGWRTVVAFQTRNPIHRA